MHRNQKDNCTENITDKRRFQQVIRSPAVLISGKGILLDCGIRQSGSKDPLPDFRMIQDMGGLDTIIISHAHMDHIGTLPIISKEYPLKVWQSRNRYRKWQIHFRKGLDANASSS